MAFQDFILEERIKNYEMKDVLDNVQVEHKFDILKSSIKKLGDSYLSKENLKIDKNQEFRHFHNEFPRKQSNNDLEYHNQDATIKFLVDWFFTGKK